MLPNSGSGMPPMGGGGAPAPAGMGGAPGGAGAGQPSKQEVVQMLSEIMSQAKQLADQYGIDLATLIPAGNSSAGTAETSQGGALGGAGAIPPPPSSPMPPM